MAQHVTGSPEHASSDSRGQIAARNRTLPIAKKKRKRPLLAPIVMVVIRAAAVIPSPSSSDKPDTSTQQAAEYQNCN